MVKGEFVFSEGKIFHDEKAELFFSNHASQNRFMTANETTQKILRKR